MGTTDDENWRNKKEVEEKRRIKKRLQQSGTKARDTEGKGRLGTDRGDTHEGGEQERDKINGRKGKIPAGFLSSELYTRARGVAQCRAVGPELLKAVFCSKARSAAMSGMSAEGAKMVGVGRGMSRQFQQLYSCGCLSLIFLT